MKKQCFCLSILIMMLFTYLPAAAETAPPAIDASLLDYGASRGTEVTLTDFDLTKEGASFNTQQTTSYTTFYPLDGNAGCYQLTPKTGRNVLAKEKFSLKPNRNYIISALIYSDFDRNNCEVDIILRSYNEAGVLSHSSRLGTPAVTNGWQRIEKTVTTSSACSEGLINIALYGFDIPDSENLFYISDFHIIELPEEALVPKEPGEGMIFGGSSGKYNMKVESVKEETDTITVTTNGAEYIFDKTNDLVLASQRINKNRQVFTLTLNKSLSELYVLSKSENEAVLTTGEDGLTFGVQMDSMMLISNHGSEDLMVDLKSAFSGKWNRLFDGHLVAKDYIGGFTVNPFIPLGTGRLCRYEASNEVDFDGVHENTTFLSSASAGWQVDYTITSGELLGVSVFPGREYDWLDSFENTYINYFRLGNSDRFAQDAELYGVDVGVLWNYTKRGWGMSYGSSYEIVDNFTTKFKTDIQKAHEAGTKVAPYMSMYFWHNRDVDEYIADVKRYRDTYGIDGVYTDGTPDLEWLAAYEGVRKLRELFPDGPIIAHQTGKHGNGGPPTGMPDLFIPAIDSYLTISLRGEGVEGEGAYWPYAKEVASGYNLSNTIGVLKGDAWTKNGEVIPQYKQNLISLLYNGRARVESRDEGSDIQYATVYDKLLNKLRINYLVHQKQTDYYNEHYLPKVHNLIRDDEYYGSEITTEAGTNVLFENDFSTEAQLSEWEETLGSSTTVSVAAAGEDNALCINDGGSRQSRGSLTKGFDKQAGRLQLTFQMMTDADGNGEVYVSDDKGNNCFRIYAGNGAIRIMGASGAYKIVGTCEPDTWYTFTASIDCGAKRFSVWQDDEILVRNMHFYNKAGVPAGLTLATGDTGSGAVYFKNIELIQGF